MPKSKNPGPEGSDLYQGSFKMLVAISDIHFVDGTAGEHNLPFGAFNSVFLSDISALASAKDAKEIKVLLLGDIVDLIRSTKWFEVNLEDRPWGERGLSDIPVPRKGSVTEKLCLKILGRASQNSLGREEPPGSLPKNTVLHKNWKTFKLFRELQSHLSERCGREIPVEIVYIPGNHDRLCNLYPSVRDAIRQVLGISVIEDTVDGDPGGQWWYRSDYLDETHGVYARHGHQYDLWNFGGGNDHTRQGHLQTPVGDVFTTEFAVKIPWMLDTLKGEYPEISKEIKRMAESAKDIDNVRPLGSVMEWLYYRLRKENQGKVRDAFNDAFDRVVKGLLDIPLIQQWRCPDTYVDDALRLAANRWLSWLPKGIVDLLDAEDLLPLVMGRTGDPADPDKDVYTQAAYKERIWRENPGIRFILCGHTHAPLQRPLDGGDEREVFYINTGTWRDRIYRTVGMDKAHDFVELKQMTYTMIFRKDEDTKGKKEGTLSFDIWTGTKKKHYET